MAQLGRCLQLRKRATSEKDFQANIADERAGVFLASTAVGFVDPKLGKKIGVLGNAYLKLAEADGLFHFSQMASMAGSVKYSSIRLTADVLSASLMVASLLNDAGPTPDLLIMQQLAAISAQINDLRREMHDRFDRVDKSLRSYICGFGC